MNTETPDQCDDSPLVNLKTHQVSEQNEQRTGSDGAGTGSEAGRWAGRQIYVGALGQTGR